MEYGFGTPQQESARRAYLSNMARAGWRPTRRLEALEHFVWLARHQVAGCTIKEVAHQNGAGDVDAEMARIKKALTDKRRLIGLAGVKSPTGSVK